jgi:hypothetical protein
MHRRCGPRFVERGCLLIDRGQRKLNAIAASITCKSSESPAACAAPLTTQRCCAPPPQNARPRRRFRSNRSATSRSTTATWKRRKESRAGGGADGTDRSGGRSLARCAGVQQLDSRRIQLSYRRAQASGIRFICSRMVSGMTPAEKSWPARYHCRARLGACPCAAELLEW